MLKSIVFAAAACGAWFPLQDSADNAQTASLQEGHWRGSLTCPGGEIPFGLELKQNRESGTWGGWVINGAEKAKIGRVEMGDRKITLHFDPYDSMVKANLTADGKVLFGEWTRYRDKDKQIKLPFRATFGAADRFAMERGPDKEGKEAVRLASQYKVQFAEDKRHSVGLFQLVGKGPQVRATFLTTLGDYRYLDGVIQNGRLQLSCFDGAHAFLFTATLGPNGRLKGDFWSRDSWHETWTGVPDNAVTMPDPFGLTRMLEGVPFDKLSFPDSDGVMRSLSEPEFQGKARLIVLFGTWCPNCNDETDYLVELHKLYKDRGLSILGLAFEFGDDFERSARVVRQYAQHHKAEFPMLIAGTSDKSKASEAFPALDKVRAYPTTLFIDAQGKVQAVYTGFSGPATGAHHARLRDAFERQIDQLLQP